MSFLFLFSISFIQCRFEIPSVSKFNYRSKWMPRELMNTMSLYWRYFFIFGCYFFLFFVVVEENAKCKWINHFSNIRCVCLFTLEQKLPLTEWQMLQSKSVVMIVTEITKGRTMAQVWLSATWSSQINTYLTRHYWEHNITGCQCLYPCFYCIYI